MTTTPKINKFDLTHHAVIQCGYAIFGVGDDYAAAIADARLWTDDDDPEDLCVPSHEAHDGDFVCLPCTPALAAAVRADGVTTWYQDREFAALDSEAE